jgi:hypothetical protein
MSGRVRDVGQAVAKNPVALIMTMPPRVEKYGRDFSHSAKLATLQLAACGRVLDAFGQGCELDRQQLPSLRGDRPTGSKPIVSSMFLLELRR